jgi:hypothetical protein
MRCWCKPKWHLRTRFTGRHGVWTSLGRGAGDTVHRGYPGVDGPLARGLVVRVRPLVLGMQCVPAFRCLCQAAWEAWALATLRLGGGHRPQGLPGEGGFPIWCQPPWIPFAVRENARPRVPGSLAMAGCGWSKGAEPGTCLLHAAVTDTGTGQGRIPLWPCAGYILPPRGRRYQRPRVPHAVVGKATRCLWGQ